ncbi:MAG: hypothetical protein ACLGJB_25055 [Blastocatellia bacterium]
MGFESNPDTLQVHRSTKGKLIAVGLPWDAKLFIQEYWSQGMPYYAIANFRNEDVKITLAEWKGAVGKSLMPSWVIPPQAIVCEDVKALMDGYAGTLVALALNDNVVHGLLRAPQPPSGITDWVDTSEVITTEGLNGTGSRDSNISCLQPKLVLTHGQDVYLTLRVPHGIGTIILQESRLPDYLPHVKVVGVISKTLSIDKDSDRIIIDAGKTLGPAFHKISIEVRVPGRSENTMVAFWGRVVSNPGAGFSFARGLIVGT